VSSGSSYRLYCIILSILSASPLLFVEASAQPYTANEVSVGADAQSFGWRGCPPGLASGPCQHGLDFPTVSFTYTRNLSPVVALEGTLQPTSWFMQTDGIDSGRETVALGGVKTGWRGRRWGLYGKLDAGMVSFSCGDWNWSVGTTSIAYQNCARLTHFALEYGGAVEFRKSPRYAFRLDIGHLEAAEFDHVMSRYRDGSVMQFREGGVTQHVDAQIGVSRTFGRIETTVPDRVPAKQKWDTGVTFALQPRIQPDFEYLSAYPSWGLWASRNFGNHFSWDSTLLHSPRNPGGIEDVDFQAGGRAVEFLSGVKFGFRDGHFGYFAKVRPGIITFGEADRQTNPGPCFGIGRHVLPCRLRTLKFDRGMFTDFVLDTGGIVEAYPTRHTILRFEAGNATIFYLPKNIIDFAQVFPIPERTQSSILISFGAGIRF